MKITIKLKNGTVVTAEGPDELATGIIKALEKADEWLPKMIQGFIAGRESAQVPPRSDLS